MTEPLPRASSADVALLLEGTYPYVSGGVSTWVHQIVRGFPDLRFAAVFIGSRPEDYGPIRYELPPNLVHLETHYLYDRAGLPPKRATAGDRAMYERVERLHEYFHAPLAHAGDEELLGSLGDELGHRLTYEDFLYSEASWRYIRGMFGRFSTDPSFVDYFWTVRNMHGPLWKLAAIRDRLIPARVYHTASTGFAGYLGALVHRRTGRPLVVSEHGIYTKERRIDLFSAEWIHDNRSVFQRDTTEISYYRQLWIRFFETLGRAAYDAASDIVALFEANRRRQVADGADPAKLTTIPNGVDLPRFAPLAAARPSPAPRVAALVGRVVPIKDVKTFVRAMRSVVNRLPDAEGWIAGPTDEDPAYARECEAIAADLGLADRVKFLGFRKVTELLPQVGVVVLSSISEGLPLVVLEGFASGAPAVTTDVGACRELVYGLAGEDAALGAAGRVVGIADPSALAAAVVELLADPDAWRAASAAALARVARYYAQDLVFARYRAIYERALAAPDAVRGRARAGS
ncbi:MAG: GT4 family glycosyltransferase PelF [Burkholderiales bacterium]|nr:GT4 family glycosyltransferase PelF [Burkholderiales bacterium]